MSFWINKCICTKLIKPEEWSNNELIGRRIVRIALLSNYQLIKKEMFCAGPKKSTCKNLKCLETLCLAFSAHHKAGNASIMKVSDLWSM
jgi:hypothetical protein